MSRLWTKAEHEAVIELARANPAKDTLAIAALASQVIDRTAEAVRGQVNSNSRLRNAITEARAAAQTPPPKAPSVGTLYTRAKATHTGDLSWSVRLPALPFALEPSPRDESRPYDRRAAFGARAVRQPNLPLPEGAGRVAWLKNVIAEVATGARP